MGDEHRKHRSGVHMRGSLEINPGYHVGYWIHFLLISYVGYTAKHPKKWSSPPL